MKIKFSLVFFVFILFVSCNDSSNKSTIKKQLIFNTRFDVTPKFSGTLFDKHTSTEKIYFADPSTEKCIKLFDINGILTDSISLKKAIDYLGEIDGISIVSLDTIIINSLYTNKITFINRKGDCWKNMELNNLPTPIKGDHFELSASCFSPILAHNSLILACSWRYNSFDQFYNKEPSNQMDYLKYFYANSFKAPYFCKISDYYNNTPKIEFGLNSFYSNISKSADVFVEPSFYTFLNDKIFVFSTYSDILFVVNPTNLQIERKVQITSDYTKIGAESIPLTPQTINKIQKLVNTKATTAGYINRLFYDSIKGIYYIIVYHQISENSDKKEKGNNNRPYSVIITDKLFSKLHEHHFSDKGYIGGFAIMTKDGLMFYTKSNDKNKKQGGLAKFTIFDFEN